MHSMQTSYKVSVLLSTVFIIEKVMRFIDKKLFKNFKNCLS